MGKVKEIEHEEAIVHCFKRNKRKYGRIRIRRALMRQGIQVSESKISLVLKKHDLTSRYGRPRKRTQPKKTKADYTSENLVKNKFETKEINKLWCADITEMKYKHGKVYVSGIIDVASRKLVGWDIATHARQEIVQNAIKMAYGRCRPKEGLIYHCDRGCQYTANATKELIDKLNMLSSMSRPGSPTDNQPIESFWKTLKQEMDEVSKMSFQEAKRTVIKYIELDYNAERLHSSLNYKTPNEVWDEQSLNNEVFTVC